MDKREKALGHNKGLNAMGAEVLNSTFVLLFGICAKLNICTSNPPQHQAENRQTVKKSQKVFVIWYKFLIYAI